MIGRACNFGLLGTLGVAAALCGSSAAWAASPAERCASLADVVVAPQHIGLPSGEASVASAKMEAVGEREAQACIVLAKIAPVDPTAPPINLEVNLPVHWNQRAVQIGGGGFDGFLVTGRSTNFMPKAKDPLAGGYVTFGSDSGHRGGDGTMMTAGGDASFGENPEALDNFAGAQIKKTHDVALALIRHFYGASPRHTYFYGNSEGGREGLIAAQRYGADYDGVVAIHPAYNFARLQLGGLTVGKALYGTPGAWLSPADTAMIGKAAMARCDGLDGLKDGLIANIAACRAAFNVESLLCNPDGSNTPCLTAPQVRTARAIASPSDIGVMVDGSNSFPGWPLLEGAFTEQSFLGLGRAAAPGTPPTFNDAFVYLMADQGVRHFFLHDTRANSLAFDPAAHAESIRAVAAKLEATATDLGIFTGHGGKLLLMHGTTDMAITPGNTIEYYEALRKHYGAKLSRFARFYLAPGFGHGDGAFVVDWDSLTALDAWVSDGHAPGPQVISDQAPGHGGRTRPLCEYPMWPRYNGAGDPQMASSFSCVR